MTTTTQTGATVEEAIETALQTLNASRDEVEIEVLEQGRKGFLGIGAKEAEVKVSLRKVVESTKSTTIEPHTEDIQKEKDEEVVHQEEPSSKKNKEKAEPVDLVKETTEVTFEKEMSSDEEAILQSESYLKEVAQEMGVNDLAITHELEGKYLKFQLESKKAALLIGKRGQTLNALQQLTQLVANKYANQFKVVRIDVGDYRNRRQQSLEKLADRMAERALRTGRKVQLEPMPPYERKVIHNKLSTQLDIDTYSEGTEPFRYLVIEPVRR